MMIAITYDKETNSVFQHFGRTEYFYLFDEETAEEKIIDNGGYSHHNLAPYLKSLGVSTLICCGIGSHGIEAVESAGLKLIPGAFGDVGCIFLLKLYYAILIVRAGRYVIYSACT